MQVFDKITIIIPSLNPDDNLPEVVQGLISHGFRDLIIVNDGSEPKNKHYFDSIEARPECTVLNHDINRGKGRALKTAFIYILEHRPDCVGAVTVDGDNQHHPDDVAALADSLISDDSAIILGSRNFSQPSVPARSRIGNRITSIVFRLICRQKISDTQTGLRAIPYSMLPALLEVSGERFEFETNMLFEAHKNRLPIREILIKTIYIDENATSHFRFIADSLSILRLILIFAFSSIACALIDIGCYWLTVVLLATLPLSERVFIATVTSRAVSSIANYFFNRHAVFGSRNPLSRSLPRYYILCVCQFICSWAGVWGLTLIIGGNSVLSKLVVDSLLFFLSFNIQRNWVFADDN